MAGRDHPLVTDQYYHVFNRGVAKQQTFVSERDYNQAILSKDYYQYIKPPIKLSRYKPLTESEKINVRLRMESGKKLVKIISYVIMPNHFHFLLQQLEDGGISKYLSLFTNSYTRYFNTANNRVGPVFQGAFKSVPIESEEQLLHLTRYIHLNPYVASIVSKNDLPLYPWSSFPRCLKEPIPFYSHKTYSYRDFVMNHSDYARELKRIEHLCIDL
ncbi:MAG: transposase [Candidatus Amesbacteria bacterium]|nr:transposase [Candidatus Amesbacteria bacterium]